MEMAFTYIFYLESHLHEPMIKKLTTDEPVTLEDFEWADRHAELREYGGVYMLFCAVSCFGPFPVTVNLFVFQLAYYIGKAKNFKERMSDRGHGAVNVSRNQWYADHRDLYPDFEGQWTKIVLVRRLPLSQQF